MPHTRESSSPDESKKSSSLTFAQETGKGMMLGTLEPMLNHPLWSLMKRAQTGQSFTVNPFVLYRGIAVNTGSMAPTTAVQMGLNHILSKAVADNPNNMTSTQKMFCAFLAGAGSTVVSCPTERIMIYQSNTNASFVNAVKYFMGSNTGWKSLYAGLGTTMMREGPFGTFFLAGTPYFKKLFFPYLKTKNLPYLETDTYASLAAGAASGVCATAVTQAVNTIKTQQQSAEPDKPMSAVEAFNKVRNSTDLGLHKGIFFRCSRVVSAITLMTLGGAKLTEEIENYNKHRP